ncbi:nucleoside-diphosphate-sugar epimerase family protein [Tothia fuscella]|uniref:Nucleoside-diphosphate-sugar epimerase family protein n=1 Tax=Tothia fuscella TaxID=1048955 RepID=A0A9P4NTV8_9PEZI|nr:nucleoside-diphosphate-sugar epimerase family protein [Tothia fuscella]
MSRVILVTGATGKQGGAVIKTLLSSSRASDFTLLGVTRNAQSASAKKLAERGVKIVQGDLNDVPAIFESAKKIAAQPLHGVFSVQVPMGSGQTPKTEEAQGKALVDAALANNVKMFVYSSVDRGGDSKSYDTPTPIPHFISKQRIEHHLVDSAAKSGSTMQYTILRPVAFMENLTPDFMGKGFATMWSVAVKEKPLQLIATADIGHLAGEAFIKPDEYAGKAISLAGDELTFEEANKVFQQKVGYEMPQTFGFLASGMLWAIKEVGIMFRWFYTDGYGADIQGLKKTHPELLSFGNWLVKESKFDTVEK